MSQKKEEVSNLLKDWAYNQQSKIDVASFAKFVAALNIELPQTYKRLLPSSMRMSGSKENVNPECELVQGREDVEKDRLAREEIRKRLYQAGDLKREQHDFHDAMKYTFEVTKEIEMYSSVEDLGSLRRKSDGELSKFITKSNLLKSSEVSSSVPTVAEDIPKKTVAGPVTGILDRLSGLPGLLSRNKDSDSPDKTDDEKKKAEKRKKELMKRPVMTKSMIDKRTRALVINVKQATSPSSQNIRLQEFCKHLCQHTDAKYLATKVR